MILLVVRRGISSGGDAVSFVTECICNHHVITPVNSTFKGRLSSLPALDGYNPCLPGISNPFFVVSCLNLKFSWRFRRGKKKVFLISVDRCQRPLHECQTDRKDPTSRRFQNQQPLGRGHAPSPTLQGAQAESVPTHGLITRPLRIYRQLSPRDHFFPSSKWSSVVKCLPPTTVGWLEPVLGGKPYRYILSCMPRPKCRSALYLPARSHAFAAGLGDTSPMRWWRETP